VEKVEGTLVGERTITAKIANEMKDVEIAEAKEAGLENKVEEVAAPYVFFLPPHLDWSQVFGVGFMLIV
jgi:hypothetical protein